MSDHVPNANQLDWDDFFDWQGAIDDELMMDLEPSADDWAPTTSYLASLQKAFSVDGNQSAHADDPMTLASPEPGSAGTFTPDSVASLPLDVPCKTSSRVAGDLLRRQLHVLDQNGPPDHTGFHCPEPGCPRQEPFKKKSDMKRHVDSKHRAAKPFVCPAKGCFKRQRKTGFRRVDKLFDHVRRLHGEDAVYPCPFESCGRDELPVRLLAIHLREAHCNASCAAASSILKMAGLDALACPIGKCAYRTRRFYGLRLEELSRHVDQAHANKNEVPNTVIIEDLAAANLACSKSICSHHGHRSNCHGWRTTLSFQCPICLASDLLDDNYQVFRHLLDAHSPENTRNASDLRLHGEEILRMAPMIAHHPRFATVWSDLAEVVPIIAGEGVHEEAPEAL